MSNANMNDAKIVRDDEFYTHVSDIASELRHSEYLQAFAGKSILCNCNDGPESNFFRFFASCFARMRLKNLVCISYGENAKVSEITSSGQTLIKLRGNGSFDSPESLEYLDKCDIVVTNPPFSLFREFFLLLTEHNKDFVIIGNAVTSTTKRIFPFFRDNKVRFGYSTPSQFERSADTDKGVFSQWYTTIPLHKEPTMPALTKSYKLNKNNYPVYDNFNAIHVNSVRDIPYDYDGMMGLPVSFLTCYDPAKYELIGSSGELAEPEVFTDGTVQEKPGRFYLNGRRLFDRVVVRRVNK